jgi:hypothetical protein
MDSLWWEWVEPAWANGEGLREGGRKDRCTMRHCSCSVWEEAKMWPLVGCPELPSGCG